MDDLAYDELVSRFGEGDRTVGAELADEARRRVDRPVLAAIELRSGPSAKEARASGDRLALGRAIAGRAGLWHTWGPLVEEVSTWPDDEATRTAVAALARALDLLDVDNLRDTPPAWWNAAQRGETPVGWPLVRRLSFYQPAEALMRCVSADSLAELTSIEADERHVAVDMFASARRLRELSYEFSSTIERVSEPIAALAVGTLERLTIAVERPADLASLRALAKLRELKIEFRCESFAGDPLTALGDMPLSTLRVVSRVALPSLEVLDELPELRVLHIERAPADPAPIGRLRKLDELMLGRANALPGLPASLHALHLIECDGLRTSAALAPLRALEVLRLSGCRALRTLDVSALPVLRELAIGGASNLECIDLGAPSRLAELRLDGLPALRELRVEGRRPASLQVIAIEHCPALTVPVGF